MVKITGFTTTSSLLKQLSDANVSMKLPFKATNFKCTKVPKNVKFKDREGKDFKPVKVDKSKLKLKS